MNPWQCCGYVFFRENHYQKHLQSLRHNAIKCVRKRPTGMKYTHSVRFQAVEYHCLYCNYKTCKKADYRAHCTSKAHKLSAPNSSHSIAKYECKWCNYRADKSSNYNKHCKTVKHSNNVI